MPDYAYPGVYIEEMPSGVRTIVGVSTSVTAFVGSAAMGPVDTPVRLQNFSTFKRVFGGLDAMLPLTYSVWQFFQNGGGDAVVVRVADGEAARVDVPAAATGTAFTLMARSFGSWGNRLRASIADAPTSGGLALFNLAVELLGPDDVIVASEQFLNLSSADASSRFVRSVLDAESSYVQVAAGPVTAPKATTTPRVFAGGTPATKARAVVKQAGDAQAFSLVALAPGSAGNGLIVEIRKPATPKASETDTFFDLTIKGPNIQQESYTGLSVQEASATFIRNELQERSKVVSVAPGAIHLPNIPDIGELSYQFAGGQDIRIDAAMVIGDELDRTGFYALDNTDIFNLLIIPPFKRYGNASPDVPKDVWDAAAKYCKKHRAMLIVDPPHSWTDPTAAAGGPGAILTVSDNASVYWPFLKTTDPLRDNALAQFAPSGAVAGIIARTDAQVGVWRAAAGQSASLAVAGLSYVLTDDEVGQLNPIGVNCLRPLPVVGPVVWGARTTKGADQLASEWKYATVRRTALFIEETLYRALQWAVFEPNDEPLWAQIRLNVGAFMQGLFLDGAFQGSMPSKAYFVRCDAESNPQINIDRGIVTVLVGFAPLKPAEFVVVQIQQMAG